MGSLNAKIPQSQIPLWLEPKNYGQLVLWAGGPQGIMVQIVNPLPPLALDQTVFPCHTKKGPKIMAKILNFLGDLAHTVDERFVLAYPADPLALVVPAWEETLINLDYLLAWCHPLLKTIRNTQSKDDTSIVSKSTESEMIGMPSSQSGGAAEITLKPSSPPGPG
ncbi:hypothetical protein DSO57_1036761 [Entomophthora muscae]|uniref:Uncharacterized protein n=1 Tax=Entomophthora muscae TaxID=34485 RepID=A0ACC2SC75_9FUNG|nr:hypothetical protein DSO57_1036761 [Entomophthora muscae]